MRRRATETGLTLIEILLALIVMVLGVLGILALFPPALQSNRESMEETNAAIIAESVADAIKNAIQFASVDTASGKWVAVLTHDLEVAGQSRRYSFNLPKLTDEWKHYPNSGVPDDGKTPDSDPAQDLYFQMGEDPWIKSTVEAVQEVNDRTDAYRQFAFSLEVRKINTLEYLVGPPAQTNPVTNAPYTLADVDPLLKLYEFRIHLFRVAKPAETYGGGSGTITKKLIATVTNRVSTR